MAIQSPDSKVVKAFLPNACHRHRRKRKPSWFFTATATQYFLAQIWTAGNDRGQELPTSGRET